MHYDSNLVVLSILIAIVAAHASLEWLPLLGNLRHPRIALILVSLLFGLGIWSMHFTGMLTSSKALPLHYDGWLTLVSLMLASVTSYISIRFMRERTGPAHLLLQASLIAAGICGMHYTGMAALEVDPPLSYDWILVLTSMLIALTASYAALAIGQGYLSGLPLPSAWRLPLEATVLGLAISGMHYTAMAAVRVPTGLHPRPGDGWMLEPSAVIGGVVGGALIIVAANLATALLQPRISPYRIVLVIAVAEMVAHLILPLFPTLSPPAEAGLATLVALGLATPVAWRLSREAASYRAAQQSAQYHAQGQEVLNRLLSMPLSEKTLREVLEEALELILELPWLPLRHQGAIFLYRPEKRRLELFVHRQLPPALLTLCREVALGQCLCGRAASSRKVQHAACVDGRHTTRYENMEPHGHYSVPLVRDGALVGVLVLYLEEGHPAVQEEVAFLESLGSTLALVIELWRKGNTIHKLAFFDPLTGLPNRSLLADRFTAAVARARRENSRFALLFLDLDGFKHINDTLGHGTGDDLLQQIAKRLRRQVRATDTLARLGGDEFVLLLTDLKGSEIHKEAAAVAAKLLDALSRPVELRGQEFVLHASCGIALWPDHGKDLEELLKAGDTAMYEAKRQGRGRFQFYDRDLHAELSLNLTLEQTMPKALEQGQFQLHYQPQYEIASGRLVGAEVLVRWHHPELGEIGPNRFIPLAEANGFIHLLGRWILRQACHQKGVWKARGLCQDGQRLSVNVSVVQMIQDGGNAAFAHFLETVMTETGITAAELELELTESAFAQYDHPDLCANIDYLKRLGIRLAMDDFGTGHSSLGRLKGFPIDTLKIDRTFIRDLTVDSEDEAIVRAVVALGHTLGLKVLAEGVETEAQLRLLKDIGCDLVQGYLTGRPIPAAELEKRLSAAGSLGG